MTAVKFCGLTRAEDAAYAAELGAGYVGVVFAGGPRTLTVEQASAVLAAVPAQGPRRVGVFNGAESSADEIARAAVAVRLDLVQLHEPGSRGAIVAMRGQTKRPVWAVLRCADGQLPADARALIAAADAVLLDAHVPGQLGGTGVTLPWERLAEQLDAVVGSKPVMLAGGLTPENVARAIGALHPDVVDVSSGVERTPGVKDHARMRAFVTAVKGATARS